MKRERTVRRLLIIAILSSITGCGSGGAVSCRTNDQGRFDCHEVQSRPRSSERVVVGIDDAGRCYTAAEEAACKDVGSLLRKRFPDVNPRIVLCPDPSSRHQDFSVAIGSINAEAFLNDVKISSAAADCN